MNRISVKINQNPIEYDIELGVGILSSVFNIIHQKNNSSYVLIYDKNIDSLIINNIVNSFPSTKKPSLIPIDISADAKSLSGFNYITDKLIEFNSDKLTTLIAVGGGSIGDLVGFVASTFYRGIDYIQIPSTLLAMIDSSIGGKTGIDMNKGKNLIGSFHHPTMILIDTTILDSLSETEINSALFEAIKYGLAIDSNLFNYISDNITELNNMINLDILIKKCCEVKIDIIQKDEKDNHIRKKLNFGHTIGHSIESIYKLRHGEAVGYGMISACYMSKLVGTLSNSDYDKALQLIRCLKLPKIEIDKNQIKNQILKDKKRINTKNHFILLNGIGESYISNDISDHIINKSILIL